MPADRAAQRAVVLSCEHASAAIPRPWRDVLHDKALLNSHRAWDAGALELARYLSRRLSVPLFAGKQSRLLVDLNRSPRHRQLHHPNIKQQAAEQLQGIMDQFYWPYRKEVREAIEARLAETGSVLHLSVHSFTPVIQGKPRQADIGLLYDPSRVAERELCRRWQGLLLAVAPDWCVRRNYPYRGIQDGLVTALRKEFPGTAYVGVELEVNQRFLARKDWPLTKRLIADTLTALLSNTDQGFL